MRFRNRNVSVGGVDDRRGRGVAVGGGAGILGLVVYLLVTFLGGGGSGLDIPSDADTRALGESSGQLRARCNADGAIEEHDDCFMIKIYNEINEIWTDVVDGYTRPRLGFFEQAVATGCGTASSQVGPFYCPADREVFIDLGFLDALQRRFGAEGRYAQAYILAHEVGHHLQTLLGTERTIREQQRREPSRANERSVALELQADCYAGVWGSLANQKGNVAITDTELEQALSAAAAVGDDRIQRKTQGRVDPESWTHGSAEQRRAAYLKGFRGARIESCAFAR